jgi:hypothetical protein
MRKSNKREINMRVNSINNNQKQQNFGFKVKSVHLKSADGTKVLRPNEYGEKLILLYEKDLFASDALIEARKMVQEGVQDLKHHIANKRIGRFLFRGTSEKPRIDDDFYRHMQFAVQKDGENYTLISYVRQMLDPETRKELKLEDWGVDPKEPKKPYEGRIIGRRTVHFNEPDYLTTTKIVEIEPENTEELAELKQMHAQMAENIAPFNEHYKNVTRRELPEEYMIDGRVL